MEDLLVLLENTPLEPLQDNPLLLVVSIAAVIVATVSFAIVWRTRQAQLRRRKTLFCPYCARTVPRAAKCSACDEPLHKLYQRHVPNGEKPLMISVVGFSGHGKTVYLASLLYALSHQLSDAWQGFYRQSLDMYAADHLRKNMELLHQGKLPESTRMNVVKPAVQLLNQMPRHNTRAIALYDPPGEAFEHEERMERFASFVQHAGVTLFLISLEDIENQAFDTEMQRLVDTYALGMGKMGGDTEMQQLVVVFTKADGLIDTIFADAPELISWLEEDGIAEMRDIDQYMTRLDEISDEVEKYMRQRLKATTFVNFVNATFADVKWCVVSALGSPPEQDGEEQVLTTTVQPRRVLDPLLHVLERV